MKLTPYASADSFLGVALQPLLLDEEKNNLILGISMRVADGRKYGEEAPLFLAVHDGDELIAAAIRTPPYNMILHCEDDQLDALDVIASHLVEIGNPLPGVNGTAEIASAFAAKWCEQTCLGTCDGLKKKTFPRWQTGSSASARKPFPMTRLPIPKRTYADSWSQGSLLCGMTEAWCR